MTTRDDILGALKRSLETGDTPYAIMLTGENPLAPSCPTNGIYAVSSWAVSTKNISYKNPPEGWDTLAAEEAKLTGLHAVLPPFVTIWGAEGKGWCVRLDASGNYTPLYPAVSESRIEELVDYLAYLCDVDGY